MKKNLIICLLIVLAIFIANFFFSGNSYNVLNINKKYSGHYTFKDNFNLLKASPSLMFLGNGDEETPQENEPEEVEPTVIYVNYATQTINGVTYPIGSDSNNGLTPQTAVKTLVQAYKMLDENKSREEQYIVIIGNHNETSMTAYLSYNESNTAGYKSNVFTKPATITGKYDGVDYNGNLTLLSGVSNPENTAKASNYLFADTTFEYITFSGTSTSQVIIFCQGRNLTMGEGLSMSGVTTFNAADTGTGVIAGRRPDFQIFAGWQSYNEFSQQKDDITNIIIKSGAYGRIVLANRMGVDRAALRMSFSKDKPFNVKLTVDIQNHLTNYDYDINTIYGGNGEGTVFMNSEVNLINGSIGRFLAGSRGNDVNDANIPGNTFIGSTVLNMYDGSIYEFYGSSYGSARTRGTSGYKGYAGNYQYGKTTINISGGTIGYSKLSSTKYNLYGGSGGAVTGYNANSSDKYKDMVVGQTMIDMDGNTYPLDAMKLNINISGGTIYGNLFAGGYGWSDRLEIAQLTSDAGYFYGDATINITGGTIKGNIYGGGKGYESYGSSKPNLATLVGNTTINISGSPIIEGNIYGGGDGTTLYPDMAKVQGDVILNISGTADIKGNIYGAGANSKVEGNTNILIDGITHTNNIFGGGDLGIVEGDTTVVINSGTLNTVYAGGNNATVENGTLVINGGKITDAFAGGNAADIGNTYIEMNNGTVGRLFGGGNAAAADNTEIEVLDGKITTLYGGGNEGDILGETSITVENATIGDVYGGGQSGDVGQASEEFRANVATSNVNIISGTIDNVYGGGNLGVINGTTSVLIGTDDTTTVINGLVYGGGKGANSSFITVTDDSNVLITGENTAVENYGSTSLGRVQGNVYVRFVNHFVNNPVSKYIRMNGIDRATTVYFDNSYVLLENKVNGELKGIEDIGNIVLPSGSGLKLSANGEIFGDFIGGGELYLDSGVHLTVDGDIENTTNLVLNPQEYTILGTIQNPYVIVAGDNENEESDVEIPAIRLSSTDSLYEILTQLKNGKAYYYIAETIRISDFIEEDLINIADKIYTEDISNPENVYILGNDAFSTKVGIVYSLYDDGTKDGLFSNIKHSVTLESGNRTEIFPLNSKIVMIKDGKYYYFTVTSAGVNNIPFEAFKSFDDDSAFVDGFDLYSIEDPNYVSTNPITHVVSYNYPEEYRFIVDFTECDSPLVEENIMFKVNFMENDELIDVNLTTNLINLYNRQFTYDGEVESDYVISGGHEIITGSINISNVDNKVSVIEKGLFGLVELFDSNGNIIDIPKGTIIDVNGNEFLASNTNVFKVFDGVLTDSEFNEDLTIKLDMSNVIPSEQLINGNYKLIINLLTGNGNVPMPTIKDSLEISFRVLNHDDLKGEVGLKTSLLLDSLVPTDKQKLDKYQIIDYKNTESRNIEIKYDAVPELVGGYISVVALKKVDNFEYGTISKGNVEFNLATIDITNTSDFTKTVKATFSDNLDEGTYRIYTRLYSKDGLLITQDLVNVIVLDHSIK